jgi:hypothetical protein
MIMLCKLILRSTLARSNDIARPFAKKVVSELCMPKAQFTTFQWNVGTIC